MSRAPRFVLAFALSTFAIAAPLARAQEIDAKRAFADLKTLASDEFEGRATGSPGGEKAAQFIEAQFKAAGLTPVRQVFDFTAGVEVGPGSEFAVDASGATITATLKDEFTPLGFSMNGAAAGEVLFAGYGISAKEFGYDDYAEVDAHGKVVIVLDGTPRGKDPHGPFGDARIRYGQVRYKAMNAREHGALAAIIVAASSDDPSLIPLVASASAGDAGILVCDLRRPVAEKIFNAASKASLEAAQREIDGTLKPRSFDLQGENPLYSNGHGPPVVAHISVEVKKEVRQAANIIATIEGSDEKLKSETIVLGAHYDHLGHGETGGSLEAKLGGIHHGADDNASGTSALLEIARTVMKTEKKPRRTIVFIAFSGEEEGLLGSAHYVSAAEGATLKSIIAMVNMDMVGRMTGKKLTVGGAGTAKEWPELIKTEAAAVGLEATQDEEGFGPSDHSSFYGKGVPVLFLFTGAHVDYHKPSDTSDKINVEGLGLCANLALRFVRAIDAMDARPTYQKTKGSPHGGDLEPGRGPSAYLGTIPDYADTSRPGVRLAGVRESSPASQAGLQEGDRIVRFDGKEIRDVQDYTYALFSKKPGDAVEIVVERGPTHDRATLNAVIGRKGGGAPSAGNPHAAPPEEPKH